MATINTIKNTYDLIAEKYNCHFKDEHIKKIKDIEVLLQFVKLTNDKNSIWDIGCGSGHTTKYLFDLGLNISGLDLSSKMINIAKNNYSNIYFEQGNMLNLNFENSSIDAIISFYSIVHFSKNQVKIVLKEIFRVLKNNGLFLFSFHVGTNTLHLKEFLNQSININFMFFDVNFIVKTLKTIGYKDIDVIEREAYPDIEFQSRRCYIFCRKSEV